MVERRSEEPVQFGARADSPGVTTARKGVPLDAWVLSWGVLTWAVTGLLPSLHREDLLSIGSLALLPAAPLVLALGLWFARFGARAEPRTTTQSGVHALRSARNAPYLLLAVYPTLLALSASQLDHDTAVATFPPWVLAIALLSLAAYLGSASALCALPAGVRNVDQRPLGEIAPIDLETRKQAVGKLVLGTVATGSLGLIAWASWATPAHLREVWGRAAPEGATLTALSAGVVGALALTMVGPGLRAERGPVPQNERRWRRVAWLLLVALSGVAVRVFMRSR
jgi:hypothetical protein